MSWQNIHNDSVVVDLHNHAVLKKFLLDRDLTGGKTKFLSTLFKRAFWPLSQRSTFPLVEKGGVDIVLSTCYIPEREWLEDQPLIKLALALSPSTKKRVFDPFYYDATISMMDAMEKEVDLYNKKNLDQDVKTIEFVKNPVELEASLENGHISMIHSVEGGHSLQGLECETSSDMKVMDEEVLQNLEYLTR